MDMICNELVHSESYNVYSLQYSLQTTDSNTEDIYKQNIRTLKIDSLINDVDNSDEINRYEKYLNPKLDYGIDRIGSTLVKSDIKLDKSLYTTTPILDFRKLILNEIYKITTNNKSIKKNFNLYLKESDIHVATEKIKSNIFKIKQYISERTYNSPNQIIMSSDYKYLLLSDINSNNDMVFGLNIIIDDSIGDKIIIYHKSMGDDICSNELKLFYKEIIPHGTYMYNIAHIGNCDYNYIEFNIFNL